jgi:alpha-tubulin suppressor-like RCC1 family protein
MLNELNNSSLIVNGSLTINASAFIDHLDAKLNVSTLYSENTPDESVVVWSIDANSWVSQKSINANGVFTTSQDIDFKGNYINSCKNTFKVKCSFDKTNVSFDSVKLVSGRQSLFIITRDQELYSTGAIDNISLGGVAQDGQAFISLNEHTKWINVQCGGKFLSKGDFAVALDSAGKMWTWGDDTYGQCAVNEMPTNGVNYRSIPGRIIGNDVHDKVWRNISCGEQHAIAIDTTGGLYMWGKNTDGVLLSLSGITRKCTRFFNSSLNKTWKSVSCGAYHTVALDEEGVLFVWGRNDQGQLGVSDFTDAFSDVALQHTPPHLNIKYKQISSGANFTAAIDVDGNMYLWGSNLCGQLGQNDIYLKKSNKPLRLKGDFLNKKWKRVECGATHVLAIDVEDKLYGWGNNREYQLGIIDTTYQYQPVLLDKENQYIDITASLSHSCVTDTRNRVYVLGSFNNNIHYTFTEIKCVNVDINSKKTLNVLNIKKIKKGAFLIQTKTPINFNAHIDIVCDGVDFVKYHYNIINSNSIAISFTKDRQAYEPRSVLLTLYNI